MSGFKVQWIAIALLVLATAGVIAQSRIATRDEYAALMRSNAQLGGAMAGALTSGSYAEARKLLASVRQNFTTLKGFWTERKKDEAVSIVDDGLKRIDAMTRMLEERNVDGMGVIAASQGFGAATCGACHALYREADNQGGFRFKPGVF